MCLNPGLFFLQMQLALMPRFTVVNALSYGTASLLSMLTAGEARSMKC